MGDVKSLLGKFSSNIVISQFSVQNGLTRSRARDVITADSYKQALK